MRIHFVGIGGIGVSALAKYYLAKGHEVSGCDLISSEITEQLKKMGAKIRIGKPDKTRCFQIMQKTHDRENFAQIEKVVYSPAVPKDHPELKIRNSKSKIQNKSKILNTKYQILSYPEALGELTKTHYTIAVSGTHGKSTTTAMLGLLLARAGLNPTVIVGTKLKEFGDSNFRMGGGRYLVIEADEHFASFLNYRPKMIVLTTVEADHLDYYKTLGNIIKTFKKYVVRLPKDGWLVANKDDKNIRKIVNDKFLISNVKNYSLKQPEAEKLRKLLKIPGEHNVANALAVLAVARALKIPDKVSFKSLSKYKGAWRRFEIFKPKTINHKPYTLVSDYGHHPTKVRVTIEAATQKWPASSAGRPNKKIWLVYQPHQYSRTHFLWNDFVKVFSQLPIQKLIITDIYDVAGRENKAIRKKVSSQKLVGEILNTKYKIPDTMYIVDSPPFKKIEDYLNKNLQGGEIVIVMGAGDIYSLTLALTSPLGMII